MKIVQCPNPQCRNEQVRLVGVAIAFHDKPNFAVVIECEACRMQNRLVIDESKGATRLWWENSP